MPQVSLLLLFFYVLFSVVLIYFLRKEHYWKVLLFTSLLFFLLLSRESFVIILYIAILTYYFSIYINKIVHLQFWMLGLILTPLVIKKVFFSEYIFDDFTSPVNASSNFMNVIGLSYITFNAIGYLVDLKRKYTKPETNFLKLLLFLIYFPIIFSGPLTRAKHFFSEIENIKLQRESIVNGLRLILWGLFKNLVVGARLFVLMTTVLHLKLTGIYYLLNGLIFFLFLYCTFSSFVNIFQGVSLLFNIKINDNFRNRIYLSASREEFWKGWHITLNQWFRDYFFYTIIKYDKKRKYTNLLLFITFLCIALWHDVTLVFLIWGFLNAVWLISERKCKKYFNLNKKFSFLGVIYHLAVASLLATIFISENVFEIYNTLFDTSNRSFAFNSLLTPNTYILIFVFVFMDFYEKRTTTIRIDTYIQQQSAWHRYFFYYTLCFLILFFSVSSKVVNYYNLF